MSADFWAGYISGAAGILIGNPLDLIKTRIQAGSRPPLSPIASLDTQSPHAPTTQATADNTSARLIPPQGLRPATNVESAARTTYLRGAAAPILGYGALNALLFTSYNRTMAILSQDPAAPSSLTRTWMAGCIAGLATWIVSTPTELIKCRVQVARETHSDGMSSSSWTTARNLLRSEGLRGLYHGGVVTALRDGVGYGFYYWSYELSKRTMLSLQKDVAMIDDASPPQQPEWMSVLLCGGIAGVVTWASIFPLDVIKTRVQTQSLLHPSSPQTTSPSATLTTSTPRPSDGLPPQRAGTAEISPLLDQRKLGPQSRLDALAIARAAYAEEGIAVFFRGLGVCSARAFVVNAVQWAVYEWTMRYLTSNAAA